MKIKNIRSIAFVILAGAAFVSCSSDDSSSPIDGDPVNTGELKLFLVDTARIKKIDINGANETTILDKHINSNSYIGGFSIAPNGGKFIYSEVQYSAGNGSKEVRIANSDGTNDQVLYQAPDPQSSISYVKYLRNDKVCYVVSNYTTNSKLLYTINPDGTGSASKQMGYDLSDLSSDEKYLVTYPSSGTQGAVVRIIDREGDNGAGGLYHSENFDSTILRIGAPLFMPDNSKVVIVYQQDSTIKVRIIDMATKTSENVDLLQNQSSTTLSLSLSIGADNNRGALTISDYNTDDPSVTYVFNIKSKTITSSFSNNDDNIFDVYSW